MNEPLRHLVASLRAVFVPLEATQDVEASLDRLNAVLDERLNRSTLDQSVKRFARDL